MLTALIALSASAHILMDDPRPRNTSMKIGPCGDAANQRSTVNVTTYAPNDLVYVQWHETIAHPSHFRISFDEDGTDDFLDPTGYEDFFNSASVLADDIPNEPDGMYSVLITIPDVECTNCTIQVIQVMYDSPPYAVGGDDLYYQCADLIVTSAVASTGDTGATTTPTTTPTTDTTDPGTTPTTPTGTEPDTTDTAADDKAGCGCAEGGPAGTLVGALVALIGVRRRR
jgi:uncharacterized protein (TIGR03382 family)